MNCDCELVRVRIHVGRSSSREDLRNMSVRFAGDQFMDMRDNYVSRLVSPDEVDMMRTLGIIFEDLGRDAA